MIIISNTGDTLSFYDKIACYYLHSNWVSSFVFFLPSLFGCKAMGKKTLFNGTANKHPKREFTA